MNTTCPNCGGDPSTSVAALGVQRWCKECGTRWLEASDWRDLPRRSQPAEVKEMPDSEGFWWDLKFKEVHYARIDSTGGAHWSRGTTIEREPCRYVKAEPPIVPPKPKDEDAEWLRQQAEVCKYDSDEERTPRFRRIADRLEKLAEGEHE